jgi:hypothetical protein
MGAVGKAASAQGTKQVSWKGHDQWKRDKVDPYSSDVQGKAGELTGAAYRTVEQIPNQLAKTGKEIGEFLNPTSPKTESSDGSSGTNYTTSTGKSSQGSGKGADLKDKKKKNVGGKSSLYKKGPQ